MEKTEKTTVSVNNSIAGPENNYNGFESEEAYYECADYIDSILDGVREQVGDPYINYPILQKVENGLCITIDHIIYVFSDERGLVHIDFHECGKWVDFFAVATCKTIEALILNSLFITRFCR